MSVTRLSSDDDESCHNDLYKKYDNVIIYSKWMFNHKINKFIETFFGGMETNREDYHDLILFSDKCVICCQIISEHSFTICRSCVSMCDDKNLITVDTRGFVSFNDDKYFDTSCGYNHISIDTISPNIVDMMVSNCHRLFDRFNHTTIILFIMASYDSQSIVHMLLKNTQIIKLIY